jgi:hypothetical protein
MLFASATSKTITAPVGAFTLLGLKLKSPASTVMDNVGTDVAVVELGARELLTDGHVPM